MRWKNELLIELMESEGLNPNRLAKMVRWYRGCQDCTRDNVKSWTHGNPSRKQGPSRPGIQYLMALIDIFANIEGSKSPREWDAWYEWTPEEERFHLARMDRIARTQDYNPLHDEG